MLKKKCFKLVCTWVGIWPRGADHRVPHRSSVPRIPAPAPHSALQGTDPDSLQAPVLTNPTTARVQSYPANVVSLHPSLFLFFLKQTFWGKSSNEFVVRDKVTMIRRSYVKIHWITHELSGQFTLRNQISANDICYTIAIFTQNLLTKIIFKD